MNTLLLLLVSLCALGAVLALFVRGFHPARGLTSLANIAEGTHEGKITKRTDAAIATRYLLGKFGSDVDHVAVCGATDIPIGFITDEAGAAEDPVNINLLGSSKESQKGVASAGITAGDFVVPAAGGKLRTLPAAAATYYIVGRALTTVTTDGDIVEVDPVNNVQRVVA